MRAPHNPENLVPQFPVWEIWQGHAFIYLVGPGPKAMHQCGRGTVEDRKLAERALVILNERHRENNEAGEAEILAVLVECGYQPE